MTLANTSTMIVGGSGAMGSAVARHVDRLGGAVVLVGRNRARLGAAAGGLDRARVVVGDFTAEDDARRVADEVGVVDHVVVALSAGSAASSVTATAPETFREVHGRLWASYHAVHLASGLVRPGGSVVLVSGSSGRRPVAGFGVWTSLYGAIEALARAAALELAPVRVNVVSPGGIGLPPDRQLVERAGEPGDIGQAVTALMVNPAITNAVLDVDGGERLGTWYGG
ncbi:MAG: SDR family oxidoreductase [Actinomycetota bacterium]